MCKVAKQETQCLVDAQWLYPKPVSARYKTLSTCVQKATRTSHPTTAHRHLHKYGHQHKMYSALLTTWLQPLQYRTRHLRLKHHSIVDSSENHAV